MAVSGIAPHAYDAFCSANGLGVYGQDPIRASNAATALEIINAPTAYSWDLTLDGYNEAVRLNQELDFWKAMAKQLATELQGSQPYRYSRGSG